MPHLWGGISYLGIGEVFSTDLGTIFERNGLLCLWETFNIFSAPEKLEQKQKCCVYQRCTKLFFFVEEHISKSI